MGSLGLVCLGAASQAKSSQAPSSTACYWLACSPSACDQLGHTDRAGLWSKQMWDCFEWQVDIAVGTKIQSLKNGARSALSKPRPLHITLPLALHLGPHYLCPCLEHL